MRTNVVNCLGLLGGAEEIVYRDHVDQLSAAQCDLLLLRLESLQPAQTFVHIQFFRKIMRPSTAPLRRYCLDTDFWQ